MGCVYASHGTVFLNRHEYHKKCIDPWLKLKRTCPMCKKDISKKNSTDKVHSPRRPLSNNNSDDTSSVHRLISSDGSNFSLSSDSTDGSSTVPQVAVEDLEETVMFEEGSPMSSGNGQVAINVEDAVSTT